MVSDKGSGKEVNNPVSDHGVRLRPGIMSSDIYFGIQITPITLIDIA